jgi:lipopolysaccharide/colanic/teichoic acid biosynthesis glycosyltransferase
MSSTVSNNNSVRAFEPLAVHQSTQSVVKRLIDIAGGLAGLFLLAIVLIPTAIAIRLDSPGPIFYRQRRCGLKGKAFTIYKFRSMVQNAEALKNFVENESVGHIFKNSRDPRITRIGRLLRKTSLDEFPQFWNVLKGEMSLVGTRPPTLDEVQHYNMRHWRRLAVKPGMTGEWQVRGRSNVKDFEDIVSLDLKYQERWTPLYDIQLIALTFIILFRGSGSY